jgi:hypothetical protein
MGQVAGYCLIIDVMSSSDPHDTCNMDTSRGSEWSPRTHSMDRCRTPSGVGICGYRIAVRWMDNTARAEFQVESECGHEQKSKQTVLEEEDSESHECNGERSEGCKDPSQS